MSPALDGRLVRKDDFPAPGVRRVGDTRHDARLGLVQGFPEVRRALYRVPQLPLLARREAQRGRHDLGGVCPCAVTVSRARGCKLSIRATGGLQIQLGKQHTGLAQQRRVQVRNDAVHVEPDSQGHDAGGF
jgi:hypothetical protein